MRPEDHGADRRILELGFEPLRAGHETCNPVTVLATSQVRCDFVGLVEII